jgi:hypothetical protein
VDWHNFYSKGSFLDINTGTCKFSETPKYFTSLVGNAYIDRVQGASSIYSPTSSGFRIYVGEDVNHRTMSGYVANAYRFRIRWCGVGKSTGPRVPNVCCGTGKAAWGREWHRGAQRIDAKACQMKGDPVWITGAEGAKQDGPEKFIGSDALYGQTYRYSTMYIHKAYPSEAYWGWVSARTFNQGSKNAIEPKYCLFGEPFPTGNMRVNMDMIDPAEYPCKGIRLVDKGEIKSNQAKICCGSTDTKWQTKKPYNIYKDIDTSHCNFVDDDSNPVVYITSLGGETGHWKVTGATSQLSSSPTGFSMSLGVHPTQEQAWQAKEKGWFVNWCGIGKAGAPAKPKIYVPVPSPNAPPPPPVTKLSEPPESAGMFKNGKSLLNAKCASYRDHREKWNKNKQQQFYAKCMAADCVQSLESSDKSSTDKFWENPGCRFRDKMGFCYAYGSAQKWCSENPTNGYCNDGGKKFAFAPLGKAQKATEWEPNQNIMLRSKGADVAGSAFKCQCMKNCGCTKSKCYCSDVTTVPTPTAGALYKKQIKKGIRRKNKDGECSCHCGTQLS